MRFEMHRARPLFDSVEASAFLFVRIFFLLLGIGRGLDPCPPTGFPHGDPAVEFVADIAMVIRAASKRAGAPARNGEVPAAVQSCGHSISCLVRCCTPFPSSVELSLRRQPR